MATAKIEMTDVPCSEQLKHSSLCIVKCPRCISSGSPFTLFKIDPLCDACNTEADVVPAEVFCVCCKEAMCGVCLKLYRRQEMSKDHAIISVDELVCNPDLVRKRTEGFAYLDLDKDVKYYCKDHNVPCCCTCFFKDHKFCSKEIDLKEELPALHNSKPDLKEEHPALCDSKPGDVIDLKLLAGIAPIYNGVTFLPGDRVMLAEVVYKQCILLSSSYQFITSHTLTGHPWSVCVLDDQEVAVSFYNQNTIQILAVVGDVIRPVRMITTKYKCDGITAVGKEEMVVNGYCGDNKSHWSLINTRGDVKCTHQYNSAHSDSYVAVNNTKTRVYVSVDRMHSLLCFDMDGSRQFTYNPDNLVYPRGVAVDRYDNIFVLGFLSNNIHKLSPDGSVLQVITSGVPRCQRAICIHKSMDMLIITNGSDRTKLHILQLK